MENMYFNMIYIFEYDDKMCGHDDITLQFDVFFCDYTYRSLSVLPCQALTSTMDFDALHQNDRWVAPTVLSCSLRRLASAGVAVGVIGTSRSS